MLELQCTPRDASSAAAAAVAATAAAIPCCYRLANRFLCLQKPTHEQFEFGNVYSFGLSDLRPLEEPKTLRYPQAFSKLTAVVWRGLSFGEAAALLAACSAMGRGALGRAAQPASVP